MIRLGYVLTASVALLALAVPSALRLPVWLLWNASASTPVGLYALHHPGGLQVGDLVAITPPKALDALMVERRYIGTGVPLLKHVAALPGQKVCRFGHTVTVDGIPYSKALDRDSRGRNLPVWQGCRRIAAGELFLMNPSVPDSFDGRYFGPLPARNVIGKAVPIFTDEDGDGRFVWFAPTH